MRGSCTHFATAGRAQLAMWLPSDVLATASAHMQSVGVATDKWMVFGVHSHDMAAIVGETRNECVFADTLVFGQSASFAPACVAPP